MSFKTLWVVVTWSLSPSRGFFPVGIKNSLVSDVLLSLRSLYVRFTAPAVFSFAGLKTLSSKALCSSVGGSGGRRYLAPGVLGGGAIVSQQLPSERASTCTLRNLQRPIRRSCAEPSTGQSTDPLREQYGPGEAEGYQPRLHGQPKPGMRLTTCASIGLHASRGERTKWPSVDGPALIAQCGGRTCDRASDFSSVDVQYCVLVARRPDFEFEFDRCLPKSAGRAILAWFGC